VYQDNANLRGPLGLVLAPNGDLITANGDAVNADPAQASELIEFTPKGQFVGSFSIDPNEGAAFGLAVTDVGGLLRLAAVEDVTNSLDVWSFETDPPVSSATATTAVPISLAPAAASQVQTVTPTVLAQSPASAAGQTSLIAPIATISTTTTSAGSGSSKSAKRKSVDHLLLTHDEQRIGLERLGRRLVHSHKKSEVEASSIHERANRAKQSP
jgi:hypothetical protein